MNGNLPDKLCDYIRTKDEDLAGRADHFWRISKPILDRQNRPNSNENGYPHVEMVERNIWRLIKESGKIHDYNAYELFILSCSACCHDFDKGLFDKLPEGVEHGEGSGAFLTHEFKVFLQNFHESVAVKKIIGIHRLTFERFQEELKNIDIEFSLSTGPVKLQKLAVVLKTADILHTDSSRIPAIGSDTSKMELEEKNKHLARASISGWKIDGTRIIIQSNPETPEHYSAFEGCMTCIKEKEWPSVSDRLLGYGLPYNLEFKIDTSSCGEGDHKIKISNENTPTAKGSQYSQDNNVFTVPYREKGQGVVGREAALQQLRKLLTESKGTAIGQTASFHGMGGLGKTQLAVEYAYRFKEMYPYGVIWISADQEIDSQLIRIAKKGNWIAPESEHKIILDIAKRRLATYSNCLIVFDNVEKIDNIKPYFPEPDTTPHLILTSRKPVPGFEPIDIDILDDNDALELLLMESGRSLDSLPSEEKDAGKEIVKELGGLPLAIEIAGAYLKYSKGFSFVNYLSILQKNLSSALSGDRLASFTSHESDLYRTLKVSESVFEKEMLLKDILDVLTWSGRSFMGVSLLSTLLDVDEYRLFQPLNFGLELRLLRKEEDQDRYEIHRLLRKVRQEEFSLDGQNDWVETICKRIGSWFEKRREDFIFLSDYEAEIDHLKQWYTNSEKIKSNQRARLLWLQAYPSYHWGRYKETFDSVKSALELYEKYSEEDAELKANIINDMGAVFSLLGNYFQALEFKERALSIREKQLGPEHPDTAISLNSISVSYSGLGEHGKALELDKRALSIREKQLGPEHPDTARSLNNIGVTYCELGEHGKALEFQERALSIREKQLGPEHPDTASSLNSISVTYSGLGEHGKALELDKRALSIREKQLGPEHPDTALSLNNIGVTYCELGEHRKALEFQERALRIFEKQLGPEHPSTALSLNNIGATYGKLGEHRKALEYQERSVKIREKQLGPEHPDTASSLNNIGATYSKLGDHRKALDFQERALSIFEKQFGPEHPTTATSLNNIGGTYSELGNHRKALEYQEQSLRIREKQLGPEHPDTTSSFNIVISTLLKIKKFSDANSLLCRFLKQLPKDHPQYHELDSLHSSIHQESVQSGFRPPATARADKKKKKSKSKKR